MLYCCATTTALVEIDYRIFWRRSGQSRFSFCPQEKLLQQSADAEESDEGEVHTDEEDPAAAKAEAPKDESSGDQEMSPVSDDADAHAEADTVDDHAQEKPVPERRKSDSDDDQPGTSGGGSGPSVGGGVATTEGTGQASSEASKSDKRGASGSGHSHVRISLLNYWDAFERFALKAFLA